MRALLRAGALRMGSRLIVGVDLDGVVFNYAAGFISMLNAYAGMKIPEDYQPPDFTWSEVLDGAIENAYRRRFHLTPGFWEKLPIYDDARGAILEFMVSHPESVVMYISARPVANKLVLSETQRALRRHGLLPEGSTVVLVRRYEDKKLIAMASGAKYVIDDAPQAVNVCHPEVRGILVKKKWNLNSAVSPKVAVVRTLAEAFS